MGGGVGTRRVLDPVVGARCQLLQAVVGSVPVAWVSVEGARTHGLRGVIYFLSWGGRGG